MNNEKTKNENAIIFGRNVRKYREKRGYTQADIANHFNLDNSTISKWESGESSPPLSDVADVANFLGVTICELMGEQPGTETDIQREHWMYPKLVGRDKELLLYFRALNEFGQEMIICQAEALAASRKYEKNIEFVLLENEK
jgi:transcriptional regulator with XRE-family HTH domain